MTVQTSQMDLSSGAGTSSLQISMVTRRGTTGGPTGPRVIGFRLNLEF